MTGAGRMNRGPYPAARKDGSDRRLRARGRLAIRRHPTIPCAPRADQLFCVPLQWLVLKCPHVAGSQVPADSEEPEEAIRTVRYVCGRIEGHVPAHVDGFCVDRVSALQLVWPPGKSEVRDLTYLTGRSQIFDR